MIIVRILELVRTLKESSKFMSSTEEVFLLHVYLVHVPRSLLSCVFFDKKS